MYRIEKYIVIVLEIYCKVCLTVFRAIPRKTNQKFEKHLSSNIPYLYE